MGDRRPIMFVIEDELRKLPVTPGVYMHKDSLGEVIYVGKAVNLRNRVRSYFRNTSRQEPKVRAMVSNIAEFEYISCATEMEALVLECNLIKKYMPRYNILLKDDKAYPFIMITVNEEYPRVLMTRRHERDGNRYFGPYTDAGAVKRILKMIDELYSLKKCRQQEFRPGVRPCLNYFIGKCPGICNGNVDSRAYAEDIAEITDILSGHDSGIISRLETAMNEASEKLEYEEAATCRDYIRSLRILGETQRAAVIKSRDIDILIPVITDRTSVVSQYKVRDGKLSGREITYIRGESRESGEILASFISLHYPELTMLPREIILPAAVEGMTLLEEFLNNVNASNAEAKTDILHKTKLSVPERGEKKALLSMAAEDSLELVRTLDEKAEREKERRIALREAVAGIIEYACSVNGEPPVLITEDEDREYRIEAYDISNFNGLDTVGGMVVYEGRQPVKNDYRKFKIRTAEGDDYGSLREVIYRRLKRARNGDKGFSILPDLMLIDGGLGQVHAVKAVLDAFRIAIPVAGLAKDDSHRTRAIVFEDGHEIDLKEDRLLFSYCGNIQEEVHRFAITYMSGVKGKKMIRSVLEDIPGIGPKRRRALMETFGSIEAVRRADMASLMKTEGINASAAENIIEFFSQEQPPREPGEQS